MRAKVLSKESSGIHLMMATAIIMIVLTQFYWVFPQANTTFSQIASLFHFLCIETFLVLSGFTIGRTLLADSENNEFAFSRILQFLKNSFRQLVPFYFFALLLNYLLTYVDGFPDEYSWKYLFFVQNFHSPIAAFFPESWIISIVVFSSLFFSCLLYCYHKIFRKNRINSLLVISVLLISMSLFFKVYYNFSTYTSSINQWDSALKSVVIYRLDSVFIGAFFYWLQYKASTFWHKLKSVFFILGLFGILFISFGLGYFRILIDTHPFFWNVFYLPFVSLSIASLLPFFSEFQIENAFFKSVASISSLFYPVYLLHFSVVLQTMSNFYLIGSLSTFGILIFLFLYIFIIFFLSFILSLALKKIYFLTN